MWGQPVVVENRSGANGNIASQLVAKAPGDGHTLLLHASSFVINPLLYKAPGYDPFRDFTPVSLVFDYKLVVVVHPSFPAKSLAELVALAKEKPGTINFASAGGVGAPTHLSVEMFKQVAGIDLVHVPYQGGAPAVNDLLAGHVPLMFNNPTQSLQHIRSGKLRGLATTGLKRMPQAPELPTVAESGFPGYDVGTWFALWAPAGTPSAVVEKITGAVARISAMDDVRKQLDENGLVVIGSTSAELAAYQKSEFELWGKLIRDTGIKLD
jgi:tripartite-type tricarboxylate transporter receptor subunit TctC